MGSPKVSADTRTCSTAGTPLLSSPPRNLLTVAYNSHVLVVVAVVDAPAVAPALAQGCLPALAVHVVQEDGSTPLAEGHGGREDDGVAAAQLATHHVGIHNVPVVVADRPPGAIVEDLHSPLAPAGPVGEPYLWIRAERGPSAGNEPSPGPGGGKHSVGVRGRVGAFSASNLCSLKKIVTLRCSTRQLLACCCPPRVSLHLLEAADMKIQYISIDK